MYHWDNSKSGLDWHSMAQSQMRDQSTMTQIILDHYTTPSLLWRLNWSGCDELSPALHWRLELRNGGYLFTKLGEGDFDRDTRAIIVVKFEISDDSYLPTCNRQSWTAKCPWWCSVNYLCQKTGSSAANWSLNRLLTLTSFAFQKYKPSIAGLLVYLPYTFNYKFKIWLLYTNSLFYHWFHCTE